MSVVLSNSGLHTALCIDWDVRLIVKGYYQAEDLYQYSNLYMKEELAVGRVEVCLNGTYGPICQDDLWNSQSVAVVCSQLGFSPYG